MAVKVVTPGNLGNEFDLGVVEAGKVHLNVDGVTLRRNVGTGVLSAAGGVSVTSGDFKHGFQAADHGGWYLLDGRLKASLSATAQAAATALGIGVNLPDARDAVVKGKTGAEGLASFIGANSQAIAQANLPNVNLTAASAGLHTHSAASAGAHTHGTDAQGAHNHTATTMDNGGSLDGTLAQANNGSANSFITTSTSGAHVHTALSAGAHTHVTDSQGAHVHTVPLGGSGTALDVRQRSLNLNPFIYLGA